MSKVSQKYQGLKSLCENSVLLHVAPAFQAGTEGRGDTKNARLKGGRYKTVPILSSHIDSEGRHLVATTVEPRVSRPRGVAALNSFPKVVPRLRFVAPTALSMVRNAV